MDEIFKIGSEVLINKGTYKNHYGVITGKSDEAIKRNEKGTWMVRVYNDNHSEAIFWNEYDEFASEILPYPQNDPVAKN